MHQRRGDGLKVAPGTRLDGHRGSVPRGARRTLLANPKDRASGPPWAFPWSLSERISDHLRASQSRSHAVDHLRAPPVPPSSPVSPIRSRPCLRALRVSWPHSWPHSADRRILAPVIPRELEERAEGHCEACCRPLAPSQAFVLNGAEPALLVCAACAGDLGAETASQAPRAALRGGGPCDPSGENMPICGTRAAQERPDEFTIARLILTRHCMDGRRGARRAPAGRAHQTQPPPCSPQAAPDLTGSWMHSAGSRDR
jgi:hypothetical protein